jgi:hypothetical protein
VSAAQSIFTIIQDISLNNGRAVYLEFPEIDGTTAGIRTRRAD